MFNVRNRNFKCFMNIKSNTLCLRLWFHMVFNRFDIDSLAVFLNRLYLIVSKMDLLPLPDIEYFMDKRIN